MTTMTTPEIRAAGKRGTEAPFLRMPDWGAAGWAGLIAGFVFMMCEVGLLPWSKGGNAWVPVRMVAAMIFGPQVLPPPPYFVATDGTAGIFLMALTLHFSLSLVFARILSTLIYKLDWKTALVAGCGFGLALYAVNFHVFTAAFPWFAAARGWVSLGANLIWGLVAAAVYKSFEKREPLVERPEELAAPPPIEADVEPA